MNAIICCAWIVMAGFSVAPVEPVEYHVSRDGSNQNSGLSREEAFRSINYAIETASDGDVILVWSDYYFSPPVSTPINFLGKAITLRSGGRPVRISAGWNYVFIFNSGEGSDSVLQNLIIDGRREFNGIYCSDASPSIQQCTIVDCQISLRAEGNSDPLVENCIFWNDRLDNMVVEGDIRFSYVQNGAPGEGNVSGDLFGENDYREDWTSPSKEGRFTSSGHYHPRYDFWYSLESLRLEYEHDYDRSSLTDVVVTADQKTAYFVAEVEDVGFQIFRGTRPDVRFDFWNIRELTELNQYNDRVAGPWISPDGRRLYYHARMHDGINRIHMAELPDAKGPFIVKQVFDELNDGIHSDALPTLSDDELTIVWQRRIDDNIDFWVADRNSIYEPFGNVRKVTQVNTAEDEFSPSLTNNGLRLFFTRDGNVYRAGRPDRDSAFDGGKKINPMGRWPNVPYFIHVTDDRTFYVDHWVNREIEGRWVRDDYTGITVDAGDPVVNPMAEPMPSGARVNMGAYGGTIYASMSENPWPNPRDLNRDGRVDAADLAELSQDWLWQMPWAD